jgi:uncharacterized caspase-like protein
MRVFARALWVCIAVVFALNLGVSAAHAETRFALVIGNDQYKSARIGTAGNDAGLVADALQAAGFAVTGAANLDQVTLRETLREFLGQVSAAGPDAVALVYLSGFGLQFNGENYFIPVDADIARDVDIPLQAVRVSDFAQPLAALPARLKIVILDAARQNPFARDGHPLASGLALVDAVPGMAIAFNAAPGTVGPDEPGPYGAYATALTEMIAAGGLSLDDVFARIRLRVSNLTQGAEIPWYVSQIGGPFFMTERAADAPPLLDVMPVADIRSKPLRDFASVDDAYAAVLALDTIEGYEQFLAIYSYSPYSRRVAAMLAVRREEIVWRRCVTFDTSQAYWSYLRRYPDGPHAWDARRRLTILRATLDPPPQFAIVDFGVPPPPPAELVFIDQPILIFAGPGWAPPPPPPVIFLPPRPREFAVLPPPPPPSGRFGLPMPKAAVVPVFVRPPPAVVVRTDPAAPAGPAGARPRIPVSLPNAVQHPSGAPGAAAPAIHAPAVGTPNAPVVHAPPGAGTPSVVPPTSRPPSPPPTAAVKPAPPPPPPPSPPGAAAPAAAKPAPPPPPPPNAAAPAVVKPAPPPPHPAGPTPPLKPAPPPPHPAPTPAVKPAPPPPPPPPPPPHPAPTPAVKPPPPSPPPPAKPPQCPAGKHPTPQGTCA